MHITHISLVHFRNYSQEEVCPSPGANLLLGNNAQGKSNFLEAIILLSTTRSYRTALDRHFINRAYLNEPIPYARLQAQLAGGPVAEIDLVITVEPGNNGQKAGKHLRLDGVQKRLVDALGVLPTVLFTPEDVSLVSGPPANRRRYLDVLLCQADRDYCRALSLYNRSLVQRNHLLRQIRARRSDPDQLYYWDKTLAENGALVILGRTRALTHMSQAASETHADLAAGEELTLSYEPNNGFHLSTDLGELRESLLQRYQAMRSDNIERGMTTLGPHRDDVSIKIEDLDAAAFGSRGQLRTAALTLRLVEASYLRVALGREPVLLFDDVMSELDYRRRHALELAMLSCSQSFTTAIDESAFSGAFITAARTFYVNAGSIETVSRPGEGGEQEPRPAGDIG